jgi:hypothetical protein
MLLSPTNDDLELAEGEGISPSSFDYSFVPEEWAEALKADTETLHRLDASEFAIRIERGLILNRWKERLEHGLFMGWAAFAFSGIDHQSLNNWMNLAQAYPQVPDTINLQLSAAYILSREDVEDARRELALRIAKEGTKVNKHLAYVIAHAEKWLLNLYLEGQVSAKAAEDVTKALRLISNATIIHYAAKWQMLSVHGIEFLLQCLLEHRQKKAEGYGGVTLFEEIEAANGWLQAGEFNAHIAIADQALIDAFISERNRGLAAVAIERRYLTKRSQATFGGWQDGRLVLSGFDPEFDLPPLQPGDRIEVEIRVKRKGEA